MIVKIQMPLAGGPEWLVYNKNRSFNSFVYPDTIDKQVVDAVKAKGGKAYFHAVMKGTLLDVIQQVEDQKW